MISKENNIKKNFIYNLLYQFLLVLLPIVTAPYISRVLGANGIGIYSYTYSIANYFVLFAMLGIATYGNRSIASIKEDKEKLCKTFTSIYIIQFSLFLFAIIIYIIYMLCFVSNNQLIYLFQIIYIFSGLIDISWCFFGLEKFKLTVTRNVIIKLITTCCIFFFVKNPNDLPIYTLIMSVGTLLSQLYLWGYFKKYLSFTKVSFKEILSHIKPIVILFIPVIAYSLYKIMDKIMIGNFCGFSEVGYYNNAEKIINIPIGIITALGTVMLPRICSLKENGDDDICVSYLRKSFKFITIVSCSITFGLIGISSIFTPLFFGIGFEKSSSIIAVLSLTIIFLSWANVIRTQYLIPYKMDKVYVVSTISGGVLNFILNLILIPKYGAVGAAWCTVIAEFVVFFIQSIMIKNKINIYKNILSYFPILIIGLIMMISVCFIGNKMGTGVRTLLCQFILGALIYIFFTIIYLTLSKDELGKILFIEIKKITSIFIKKEKEIENEMKINDDLKFSNKLNWCYMILAFFILFTHCNADFIIVNNPYDSVQKFVISLVNIAVSTFFFISAFMFFKSINKRKYWHTIINKTKTLIYPFFMWNLIMLLFKIVKFSLTNTLNDKLDLSFKGLIMGFLNSSYNPVLWFSLDLFVLFLIYPLFKFLLKNKYLGSVSIIISIIINLYFANIIQYSWIIYWVPVFMLGGYIGLHFSSLFKYSFNFKRKLSLSKKIIYNIFLLVVFILLVYFSGVSSHMEFVYRLITPILFWLLLDNIKFCYMPPELQNSFFIYSTQILFISIINKVLLWFDINNIIRMILWITSPIIIITLQSILAVILRKFSRIWLFLFGSRR